MSVVGLALRGRLTSAARIHPGWKQPGAQAGCFYSLDPGKC